MMPGYNAARTVADTFKEIPPKYRKDVILIDDGSRDNTIAVSKRLGIKVFSHPNNLGYGGAQKTGYWEALKSDPDVVVMLHPDYQYDATMMPYLVQPILDGKFDYMFGSRIATKSGALKGGMPLYKYLLNRIVCFIQNILLGVNFSEHFSGYRAFSKNFLKTIPFQRFSNDFVFDQEIAVSAISYGMRIGEIPIPTRYHEKQSSIKFLKGTKFILDGFWTIFRYLLHGVGIINDHRFASRKNEKQKSYSSLLAIVFFVSIVFFLKSESSLGIWFGFFILTQSVLLYLLLQPKPAKPLFNKVIFIALALLAGLFVLTTGVRKDIFYISSFERNQMWERREMYRRELGIVGRSNFGNATIEQTKFYHDRPIRKVTDSFDLSRYFSADAVAIYSLVFFPLFVLGVLTLLSEKIKPLLYCLGIAVVGAFLAQPGIVYWLFVPLINSAILIGLFRLITIYKNKFTHE